MAELGEIRDVVRERYAGAARSVRDGKAACCGASESSCGCGTEIPDACGDAGFGCDAKYAGDPTTARR